MPSMASSTNWTHKVNLLEHSLVFNLLIATLIQLLVTIYVGILGGNGYIKQGSPLTT